MMVRVLLEPTDILPSRDRLRWLRVLLLSVGVVLLGYTSYVYLDAWLNQARDEQALDIPTPVTQPAKPRAATPEESLIGRIEIPRLNVRAAVREGTTDSTLRRAVGHVSGTAMPGDDGNVGLAGHRDSFFRGLRDVQKDDVIKVQTFDREFEYKVESTRIVTPKDVQVLAPTPDPVLTLVTCYPFYYVGNAPRRFIVRARQIGVTPRESPGS